MSINRKSKFIAGLVTCWCALLLLLAGCTPHGRRHAGSHLSDELNRKARFWQYRDLDSAAYYATKAYDVAGHYVHGRAVACNMLGFVAFMRMEYDKAVYWYDQVEERSGCELERLVADVGRMHIYSRIADNLSFYDCRVRGLKRLSHISEESELFTLAEQCRLQSTMNEFHMVSALHHYMIGQRPEAVVEMCQVVDNEILRSDSAQWLLYTYIKGLGLDVEGETREQRLMRRYVMLSNCLRTSRIRGYRYFEGLASLGLSELLASSAYQQVVFGIQELPDAFGFSVIGAFEGKNNKQYSEVEFNQSSLLAAHDSKSCFDTYGDRCGAMNATVQIASLHNRMGNYEVALGILDTLTTVLIPDAQARRHEEMSVAHAGLGDKRESDHHRNLYLDILENTRQDKEMESRYLSLQQRSHMMKTLFHVVVVGAVLLIVLLIILSKRGCRRGYEKRLREQLHETEKRVYLYQKHIETGKRDNIVRKASLSIVTGMMPYIDRMAHEVERLQQSEVWTNESLRTRKLAYITELADEINHHNEQLACWVKTRQGEVRLTIESFSLTEVFDMIGRGTASFSMRGITLYVCPTTAIVKADKALTFFMLNTLADNARKFTPEGGKVTIAARVCDDYVELSVSDTGVGMSADDVHRLLHEKVCNASSIGQTLSLEWRERKGSGFGLLNCKGIIDKYRKTDSLFDVCCMGIDSKVGEGSRFWFRLPRGMRRMILLAMLICQQSLIASPQIRFNGQEEVLIGAATYADSVYYANVEGRYADAIAHAHTALQLLNAHHRQYADTYIDTLAFERGPIDVETRWWLSDYATDYHTILDIRNELAVAHLALSQLPEYRYNNRIYNDLYKLVSEDRTLIDYCDQLQRYYSNISVAVFLCLLLAVGCFLVVAYAFVKRARGIYHTIENAEDDERRARYEEHRLHVQNMVLDNCLSTLKHETVYYPNRIKQLVERLAEGDELHQIEQLIAYYRVTFATLAECASRQVCEVTFRQTTVSSDVVLDRAARYHARQCVHRTDAPSLTLISSGVALLCDESLVSYLLELLLDASLAISPNAPLKLCAAAEGNFVCITLFNCAHRLDTSTLNTLFHLSSLQGDSSHDGTPYIICRQIIREHDEHFSHIGCRIKAVATSDGYAIWFTLPKGKI